MLYVSIECLMNEMMNLACTCSKWESWTLAAIWQDWKIPSETLTEIALSLSVADITQGSWTLNEWPFMDHVYTPHVPQHPEPIMAYHHGLGPVLGQNPPTHTHRLGDGSLPFIPEETISGGWEHINHFSFSGSMALYGIRVSFAGFNNRNNGKRNTVCFVLTIWTDAAF